MKKLLTKMFNLPIYRHVFRMAIVCLCLGYATVASAEGDHHYAKLSVSVAGKSTGSGTIYVSPEGVQKSSNTSYSAQDLTFTVTATPDADSYVSEWIKTGVKTMSGETPNYTAVVSASSADQNNPTTASLEVVFDKVVAFAVKSPVTVFHTPGQDTEKSIGVTVNNGGTAALTPTIENSNNAEVFNYTVSGSGADWQLLVTVDANAQEGDTAKIKLTTQEGKSNAIVVKVREVQVVQFLAAENGSYSVTQTLSGNLYETFPKEVNVSSDEEGAFAFKFNPSSTDYRFNRLICTYSDGAVVYLYDDNADNELTTTINASCTIQPEFISNDYAQFIALGGDTTIHYSDLHRAIEVVKDKGYTVKVIAVYNTGGILRAGEYNLPTGFSLLVPGKKTNNKTDYTYLGIGTNPTANDFATIGAAITPTQVCKLVVESGTVLNVSGGLCVYGVGNYATSSQPSQIESMRPGTYGWMELHDNVVINMKSGSTLHALGYITNIDGTKIDSESLTNTSTEMPVGQIFVESGAVVHEVFKMNDWRGGDLIAGGVGGMMLLATSPNTPTGMIKNAARVFPICQYYMQNIEVPIEYTTGSQMKITSIVGIGSGSLSARPIATADFIVPNSTGKIESGLFRLGSNSKVIKYYDVWEDRIKFIVERINPATTESLVTQLHTLKLTLEGKLGVEVAVPVQSSDYVLPITTNMDIVFRKGAMVEIPSGIDIAFLPGSSLSIAEDATLDLKSKVYVYDRDDRHFTTTGDSNIDGHGYFSNTNTTVHGLKYRPGPKPASTLYGNMKKQRTDGDIEDVKWLVDGKVLVNGALYTTAGGANITSSGGGSIVFNSVGADTDTTHQAFTYGTGDTATMKYPKIPITKARLHNDESINPTEPYAAGNDAVAGETYIYVKDEGKWLKPKLAIPTWKGNDFYLTLPNDSVQKVVCPVIADAVIIRKWTIDVQGEGFEQDSEYKYENDTLSIPIKYTPKNIHNIESPCEGLCNITITYYDPSLRRELTKNTPIPLKATEDYTPNFSVAIYGTPLADGASYDVSGFLGMTTTLPTVITPTEKNVTTLSSADGLSWHDVVESPFDLVFGTTLAEAELRYEPTVVETGEDHLLMVIATYTDAVPRTIRDTVTITLKSTSDKQPNNLSFAMLRDTVVQGGSIDNIFDAEKLGTGLNNITTITYKDEDALEPSTTNELVSIRPNGSGNYILEAQEVASIVEPRVITIEVAQSETATMYGGATTMQIVVLPVAIWHWSDLYFGSTNINPVTPPQENQSWTLTLLSCEENLLTLSGDWRNGYTATVGTPSDETRTYTATFQFKQGTYTKQFTSNIYADPRVVTYCVDQVRTYKGVTVTTASTGITFDDVEDKVNFASDVDKVSTWTIQLMGVPNTLTFTPLVSDNEWRIEEYNGTYWTTTYNLDYIPAEVPFTHALQPSTQQIRITYAAGSASVGVLQNVCVYALEGVTANVNKIYMPVAKDATGNILSTTQKIVLYSMQGEELSISLSTVDMELDVDVLPAAVGAYVRQEVVITNKGSNISDIQYLYVKKGAETLLTLPIQPFEFRQGLPINTEEDPSERYYFLTTASASDSWTNQTANVNWDGSNKTIVFQNSGSTEAKRSVALAYEGAADYISFHTSVNVTLSDWIIEESPDGMSWPDPVDSIKTIINNGKGIKQPLKYTTRYVRITYKSENLSKVLVSNLNIVGSPHLIANPMSMTFNDDVENMGNMGLLTLTTMNLQQIRIVSNDPNNFKIIYDESDYSNQVEEYLASSTDYPQALGINKVGDIQLGIVWQVLNTIDDATLTIYNTKNDANPNNDSVLAVVHVLGAKGLLTQGNAKTGLYTGIPDGTRDVNGDGTKDRYTYHGRNYTGYKYHEVDVTNAFATDGKALFDYLFIFGETKPSSGTNITAPQTGSANEETNVGSNAQTPLYVYKKTTNSQGDYVAYQFVGAAETNSPDKPTFEGVIDLDDAGTTYIDIQDSLRVYITGFCPYATTGYTKNEEGVFLFRGNHESKLDIYLEDCHIFSRNKTKKGNTFYGNKEGSDINTDGYTRGSGGVLVFENMQTREQLDLAPMKVSIHTRGNNLLNSNHGCYFGVNAFGQIAMKAAQVSSPIHIHMHTKDHAKMTKTTLNFDDIWPTAVDANNEVTDSTRTNGFLALKKQNNNAPSIDMGNKHTTVNFYGGRVELQNSQIVSDTYKTTLAISHRSGYFGADDAGFQLCYGIGTDSVGGTVNFYDGTVTVERMWVDPAYRQYYLMDVKLDVDGDTVRKDGNVVYSDSTSCLRLPKNTYVYGGSHCSMRACQHVTSKGGAPKDGPLGSFLGQYIYTLQNTDSVNPQGLAVRLQFPQNLTNPSLVDYLTARRREYYLESVSPDASNKLYFWIPDGYGGVTAEQDKFMSIWKACMTEIKAGISGIAEGSVGGDTPIEPNEEVKYFLYCQIDKNIHDVISAGTGEGDDKIYSYKAPIEVPTVAQSTFGTYTRWAPSRVSDSTQYQVLSDTIYTITDRVYYITNATADLWQTFTAPFDVAKIYVVESYSEEKLEKVGTRAEILKEQAKHNADFAAFFGVAMAMGTDKSFEQIYDSYIEWAIAEDRDSTGIWDGKGGYTLRSMQELIPYYGSNWRDANFYLNVNNGKWVISNNDFGFESKWEMLPDTAMADGILLHKGETYSMLFPYCMGCGEDLDSREYWDYWSGKFLIFESPAAPQTINGRDFLNETKAGNVFTATPDDNEVIVTGNSTFAYLDGTSKNIYKYIPMFKEEFFAPITSSYVLDKTIYPTTAFLYGDVPTSASGAPARKVTRTGEIIYDDNGENGNQGSTTGGHIPTVGGGNDLYITQTDNGINIAVAAPQNVRVLSSTGAVLYSGMVHTAVDVAIPVTGVYVVTGANEVHKILY